jgi:hypothetical protein
VPMINVFTGCRGCSNWRAPRRWSGLRRVWRVPLIRKQARQITLVLGEAQNFHRIGLRIVNQRVTKSWGRDQNL